MLRQNPMIQHSKQYLLSRIPIQALGESKELIIPQF